MKCLRSFFYPSCEPKACSFIQELDQHERKERLFPNLNETVERGKELLTKLQPGILKASLAHRILALQIRTGLIVASPTSVEPLIDFAAQWKIDLKRYPDPKITSSNRQKLQECACYKEFLFLLLENKHLREELFKWVIQDNNDVLPFLLFPSTQRKIKNSYLACRIGRFAGEYLNVDQCSNDITLKIDGKQISLLNEAQVVDLGHGWQTTVREIFKQFKEKNINSGNVYFDQRRGVINWCTHLLGPFDGKKVNPIPLNGDHWWTRMPSIKISPDFLKHWLNLKNPLKMNDWILIPMGNRQYVSYDVDKSHGLLGVAIPDGRAHWHLYCFGKYAKIYPLTLLEMILFIGNTVIATIQGPDESFSYSNRQIGGTAIVVQEQKGMHAMSEIAKWIQRARDDSVVFQLIYENCAFLPEEILNTVLGDECPPLFRRYILNTEPTLEPLSSMFRFIMFFPTRFHRMLILFFEVLILSHRGHWVIEEGKRVFKSLLTSDFNQKHEIFLPAGIFQHADFMTYGNDLQFPAVKE